MNEVRCFSCFFYYHTNAARKCEEDTIFSRAEFSLDHDRLNAITIFKDQLTIEYTLHRAFQEEDH